MRPVSGPAAILCAAIVLVAPASARPSAADFQLFVTAGSGRQVPTIPNNGTANIAGLAFRAGAVVDNNGGEEATASIRFVLAEGLRFGSDLPDSSESCATDGRTAQCQTPLLIGTEPSLRTSGWDWDVIADGPGSYVLRAEITHTSVVDPDITSNTASATVVVSVPTAPNPSRRIGEFREARTRQAQSGSDGLGLCSSDRRRSCRPTESSDLHGFNRERKDQGHRSCCSGIGYL